MKKRRRKPVYPFVWPDPPPAERPPVEERREALYKAIERAQAFMHKKTPPDEMIGIVRSRYPAPSSFLESNHHTLQRSGIKHLDAYFYSHIPDLTRVITRQNCGERPMLRHVSEMAAYLRALFIGAHDELFYLVMLNNNGRLIDARLLQHGSEDSAPFYLRPVLNTAVFEKAKYVVLAHNHPGGTLRPSLEDLQCTLETLRAISALQVPVLDHIIIVRYRTVSIRESGLIPELLWNSARKPTKIMREWLDVEFLVD